MNGQAIIARHPRWLNFLAGLLVPLAFAPFDAWWLLPLLLLVPVIGWPDLPPRDAFRAGFAFGAGTFLAGTYWLYISVHVFGGAPLWLAIILMLGLVLIMALYFGLIAGMVSRYLRDDTSYFVRCLVLAGSWVLFEWLRGWVLSGFPWLSLGYSQLNSPLGGFAPLLGVYGISLVVIVLTVSLARLLTSAQKIVPLIVLISLLGIGQLLRGVDWTDNAGASRSVALIQGSESQDQKWLPENRRPTLELYWRLTRQNLDSDIIIWPEVALPIVRQRLPAFEADLDKILKESSTSLAYGILDARAGTDQYYNALVTLGTASGTYNKHHLVPFGEYFPVPDQVREWMRLMSLPAADLASGAARQGPLQLAGMDVAASICYEDAFASEQRHFFPDARFIVNVTNDAWFGDSIAPHHHLDIARMRSLESGRWQLRVANTGITAIIDARGRVVERLPQFETGVLNGRIEPRGGLTPYLMLGNSPLILLSFLMLGVFELRRRRAVL